MKISCLLLFLLFFIKLNAQEHAWVYFNDKLNETTYYENPLTMLSQRALDRRTRQNIALDFTDIPITNTYINQIIAQNGIVVKAKSKWLNALHIIGSIADIQNLENLSFVNRVVFASNNLGRQSSSNQLSRLKNKFETTETYDYGSAFNQTEQLGVDFLHENDYTGLGMQIAVIDAGFPGVETFDAFQNIRTNNQILGTYNFVDRNANVYTRSSHGMSVLSTIAGFKEGEIVGTAPNSKFYLFITEDIYSETPLEESLWVEAVEKSDSLGVDIINTSLGYQAFDESKYNHSYSDFNGQTTFISRAASMVASKGMISVTAAGNSGTSFHYIAAPADATNILAVGAIDGFGDMTYFSSYGPSYDGRVKPDVDAKGGNATIVNSVGNISTGNGTSFASPILCGAVASFWQAFPAKTSYEIMQIVRESAHLYQNPTAHFGYGIPDFSKIFQTEPLNFNTISIYPNPLENTITIKANNVLKNVEATIYTVLGAKLFSKTLYLRDHNKIELHNFSNGIYFLKLENQQEEVKIIKFIKN